MNLFVFGDKFKKLSVILLTASLTPTDVKTFHFTMCYFFSAAGSEAKLLDSLNNTTIPMWWDDIDSAVILEKMTVLIYNKVIICNFCPLSVSISFQSRLLQDVY